MVRSERSWFVGGLGGANLQSIAGDEGYQGMIETLRSLIEASGRDDIITGAPQCPLDDADQHMLYLLQNVQFDRLWIQFYNNPQCELLNTDGTLNSGFNYDQWESFLSDTPNANAKLHVGLPGSAGAAGTGYVDATVAGSILCSCQSGSMFDGLMLWDQTFAAANIDESGISYNEALYEAMRCGCGECPVSTTASSVIYSTSATSISSSTLSPTLVLTTSSTIYSASTTITSSPPVAPTTSVTSSFETSTLTGLTTVSSPSYTSTSPIFVSTSSAASHSHSHSHTLSQQSTVVSSSLGPSGSGSRLSSSGPVTFSVVTASKHSHSHDTYTSTMSLSTNSPGGTESSDAACTYTYATSGTSNSSRVGPSGHSLTSAASVFASQTTSIAGPSPISSASSGHLSTRPDSTGNSTWTSNAGHASSTDATSDSLPTSSLVDVAHTSGAGTGAITSSSGAAGSTSAISGEVTSTIWTTKIYTVTSCAPTVTDCPAGTHHSTTRFPVSTIVVPGPSTTNAGAQSETRSSSIEQWTTSTIFSTSIYTITSCATTITDCPARIGSVTTDIIAVTTTVCPVTSTEATSTGSSSPAGSETTSSEPTGSSDSSSSGSGSGSAASESDSSGSGGSGSEDIGTSSGSSPEFIESSSTIVTSGTVTTTTHVFSTVFVSVPTSSSSAEGSSPPQAANNAGAPGAGYAAPSGFGAGHRNSTATKTYSLAKVKPTGVVVSENIAPFKSTSATSPIVTGGVGRSVSGAGLALLVGAVALVL